MLNHFANRAGNVLERLSRQAAWRPIVAVLSSVAKSAATGRQHRFSYDRRGWWVNQQPGATFFSPTLFTATVEPLERQVADFWLHGLDLQPGAVVVDVGAGIGDHVLVFSRMVGLAGRVIAIEAHPATAKCLQLTVEHNGLSNTTVIEEAAWDSDGLLRMTDEDLHEGNAVLAASGSLGVRARPVDDMIAHLGIPEIGLLKLNIEGAEVRALQGMPKTLASARAVVVSCHDFLATAPDDSRRTKARVIPLLQNAGFQIITRPDAPLVFVRDYVYGRRA